MVTIRFLDQPRNAATAAALCEFEEGFTYPLGESARFRISHGEDYALFYRSIAPESAASCIATDERGAILGTLSVALRPLRWPDGTCRSAAYLGDLKMRSRPGAGRVLVRLAEAVTRWGLERGAVGGYAVVMDGTARSPAAYTGRLGVRAFRPAGRICFLRLPASASGAELARVRPAEIGEIDASRQLLAADTMVPLGGEPRLRSSIAPRGLMLENGAACGVLEDTRLAKRLLLEGGGEMLSAHLSRFAYADPAAGVALLRSALAECARSALAPALFAAIPHGDLPAFRELLRDVAGLVEAPATVYAAGVDNPAEKWSISSSEV